MRTLTSCALGALLAGPLDAQQVRGTVVDSTSRLPIAGAVVSTSDSIGRIGRRSITNERGAYVVTAPVEAVRLRIVRLGFRPVDVDLPPHRGDQTTIAVVMSRIPFQLQPVRITAAASCARRSDRALALALLEQARAGLLATIVARSERPAQMKRLLIERRMVGTSNKVTRHHVRLDSVKSTVASFAAARSAAMFVRHGFAVDSGDSPTYFAPDAEVLMDDGFAAGYCFHIMDRNRRRPNQIGLGFKAADRREGRVDVDGAVWIDTVARSLVDIEFRYVGLGKRLDEYEPGGRVQFRELPNGVVLIDRWFLRVVGEEPDTANGGRRPLDPVGRARFIGVPTAELVAAEVGGELARATWENGSAWAASLGTLSLTVETTRGAPMAGITVNLDDTDYRATTDSAGHLEILDLAPGPYSAFVVDAALEPLGIALRTPLTFVASRGATNTLSTRAQTAEEYVRARCQRAGQKTDGGAVVIGRVATRSGAPVKDVQWKAQIVTPSGAELGAPVGQTGSDGIFHFCSAPLGSAVSFSFEGGNETVSVSKTLADVVTVVPVMMSVR